MKAWGEMNAQCHGAIRYWTPRIHEASSQRLLASSIHQQQQCCYHEDTLHHPQFDWRENSPSG